MLTLKIILTIDLCVAFMMLVYQAVNSKDKPLLCMASAVGMLAVIVAIAGVWNG